MPFGDSRVWTLPWRRVQGFPANEINDATGGASANVQTYLDLRRDYKGKVATLTARNALSGLSDGDWVIVLDSDGSDNPVGYVWRGAPISAWKPLTSNGTDAQTLQGAAPATAATAGAIAKRDGNGDLAEVENMGDLPFVDFLATGYLDGFVGLFVDSKRVRRARTLCGFAVTSWATPASGTIGFDVYKVVAGGAQTLLFSGTLACNGGVASTEIARAGDAIAAGELLALKITSAPAGAADLRCEAYE